MGTIKIRFASSVNAKICVFGDTDNRYFLGYKKDYIGPGHPDHTSGNSRYTGPCLTEVSERIAMLLNARYDLEIAHKPYLNNFKLSEIIAAARIMGYADALADENDSKHESLPEQEFNAPTIATEKVFRFEYMLLSRLQSDCKYYLGNGGRNAKHLWAGEERAQIAKMRELYDRLPAKPEWITPEQIEEYATQMGVAQIPVPYENT